MNIENNPRMTQNDIEKIINSEHIKRIIDEEDFYFSKASTKLHEWINMEISEEIKDTLIRLSDNYIEFMELEEINPQLTPIKDIILEIISYCDHKAREKNSRNQYQDKRVLANASVRMGNWFSGLVRLKFNTVEIKGQSIINAFDYLLDPLNNSTILSVNHRKQVIQNLVGKKYNAKSFIDDLKSYFKQFNLSVKNELNYTYLISSIVYSSKEKWLFDEKEPNKYVEYINYWVFQGNPKVFDFKTALQENLLNDWTVTAHKDKIKVGDKVILWITGNEAGCYALAEVTSEPFEKQDSPDSHLWKTEDKSELKANIKILHNLVDSPILKSQIEKIDALKNLKVGSQGTNFSASSEQFNALLELIKNKMSKKYWLYAPGENASKWDEFYELGIMGLGWDELGDLNNYANKEEIAKRLRELESTTSSKKNDATANDDFKNGISIGDVIIAKKGRKEYLGYGIVSSDYYYDASRDSFQKMRKVNWMKKGVWTETAHPTVIKTLTDITSYTDYVNRLKKLIGIDHDALKNKPMIEPINQILYGPPGTGKTYKLKSEYFPKYTTKENALTQEQYFDSLVRDLTWWQVITLALIEEGTSRVNDLFNNRWVAKKGSFSESKNVRATLWGTLQMHTIQSSQTVSYTQRQAPLIFDKLEDKTWQLIESEARENCPDLYELLDKVNNFNPNPDKEIKRYVFTTFHQSFGYEDFIEGIKPIISNDETVTDLAYTIEDGIFKQICSRAETDPENRYAIFIDEINRGNVSAIFGELITLIEKDKRIGMENALKVKLPYSKKEFGVPANLDVYGTMNTADRSVEALDTALRRRFSFTEMPPLYEIDDDKATLNYSFAGSTGAEILRTINSRIEKLLDRDHLIGHSYFLMPKDGDPAKKLIDSFYRNIIPLLQEYFYGDYAKIGAVLGKGFIKEKQVIKDKTIFADFDGFEDGDYNEKAVYEIVDYRAENLVYELEVEKTKVSMNFEKAIRLLMNQSITAPIENRA